MYSWPVVLRQVEVRFQVYGSRIDCFTILRSP